VRLDRDRFASDGALHRVRNRGGDEASAHHEGAGRLDVDGRAVGRSRLGAAQEEAASGDGLIIPVGSPRREFIGDAVLGSRYRPFSDQEIAALPAGIEFDHGLTLKRARVWPEAIPIEKVWSQAKAASSNPRAHFLGAINTVRSQDAALIVAEGTGRAGSGGEAASAIGQTGPADAEDARIIVIMNARRAAQGKPPLTPEQETQVRENRQVARDR
jgi:hypothetical protein